MKRERKNRKENTVDMAFKGVLYPDDIQRELIEKTLGCCRYVYNRFLNERLLAYWKEGKNLSYTEQCNQLPKLKTEPETEWLKEVDSTALQNSVRALQDGYDSYFRSLKKGPKKGR
ncbi:MAG: helix-turn-helix domain-containing protein, partial [Clostridia bacterium]|nr:helix-turn-helix domain-containing protein [Clostridia bacterium]